MPYKKINLAPLGHRGGTLMQSLSSQFWKRGMAQYVANILLLECVITHQIS